MDFSRGKSIRDTVGNSCFTRPSHGGLACPNRRRTFTVNVETMNSTTYDTRIDVAEPIHSQIYNPRSMTKDWIWAVRILSESCLKLPEEIVYDLVRT